MVTATVESGDTLLLLCIFVLLPLALADIGLISLASNLLTYVRKTNADPSDDDESDATPQS